MKDLQSISKRAKKNIIIRRQKMRKRILGIAMALAMIVVMALPMGVSAAPEGDTTDITGDIGGGYSFTAPTDLDLGAMTLGATKTGNATAGNLTGNNVGGYTVTGVDAKGTNTGKMVSGANVLTNKFKIGKDAGSVADSDSSQTLLAATGAGGSFSIPLYVSQDVEFDDPAASDYTITITFTVTAN
jgi:hypothetical protein